MATHTKSKISKNKASCRFDVKNAPVKHRLVEAFWLLGPAFTRWAESHMTGGLTQQRVRLMVLLLDNGPMMMSGLRDELGVTATNITALVDALEKDGMVRRRPHATDRRATMIEITAKAEKKLSENCSEFKERVSTLFSDLSKADQEQLLRSLNTVREALIARNILEDPDKTARHKKAA